MEEKQNKNEVLDKVEEQIDKKIEALEKEKYNKQILIIWGS